MTQQQSSKPDPLQDLYELALIAAYDAARNCDVSFDDAYEYMEAAMFIGARLGKSGDDVVNDCINYSIQEMERSGQYE